MRGGRVLIVGAGPGDPELMTVKAVRALGQADVVVFDRLVSAAILDLAPARAQRIDVGKRAGSYPMPQPQIDKLLVRLARAGHTVVRLKGGDPFLFGRGGEEALELTAAGVPFEVVPGITSAQGCAASLKLPLTHRNLATGVRFITGHRKADRPLDFDWAGLADQCTTLVVYMGLANIGEIAARLVEHGRCSWTPVAAISRGTQGEQQHLVSTLGQIAGDVAVAALPSPVLFIIGEVVDLALALQGCAHGVGDEIAVAAQ